MKLYIIGLVEVIIPEKVNSTNNVKYNIYLQRLNGKHYLLSTITIYGKLYFTIKIFCKILWTILYCLNYIYDARRGFDSEHSSLESLITTNFSLPTTLELISIRDSQSFRNPGSVHNPTLLLITLTPSWKTQVQTPLRIGVLLQAKIIQFNPTTCCQVKNIKIFSS